MATAAHCYFCFECLSASFEDREPPLLEKVEELWEQYEHEEKVKAATAMGCAECAESEAPSTENIRPELDNDLQHVPSDDDEPSDLAAGPIASPVPQNPSISRLQASSTSSARSSNSSTPSIVSSTSSNSALTTTSSSTSISTPPPSYASRAAIPVTASYPLFVTWSTLSPGPSHHKSLRGCIGTFTPSPLETGLSTYALTSAFDDSRFSPIPSTLLPSLHVGITLLAEFEPCDSALDWEVGLHGLRISFTYRGRRCGATYLPDVAVEQGWSKEEALGSLMRKAGWDGSSSAKNGSGGGRRFLRGRGGGSDADAAEGKKKPQQPWDEVQDFRAVRYQGLKAQAGYAEWMAWKRWADARDRV